MSPDRTPDTGFPSEKAVTRAMQAAVDLLRVCDEPWAAVTVTQPTRRIQPFGFGPVSAFVNLRTARALTERGLLEWSGLGPFEDPTFQCVRLVDHA